MIQLNAMSELKLHKNIKKHGRQVSTHGNFYIF